MILLENTIREFLNNSCNYIGYKKSTVKNLLQSEKEYSLLSINGKGAIDVEELAAGIKDSVSARLHIFLVYDVLYLNHSKNIKGW